MTSMTQYPQPDTATRAACLERLATALSGYRDLEVAMRADGPARCLAVRNTAIPALSETITVSASSEGLAYLWSWGRRIGDASDPDSSAYAIAYVLAACGAALRRDGRRPRIAAMPKLDRAIQERNRRLPAQRLNWPPGALGHCRDFERDFPGWYAWWSATHGGYGASPVTGPAIRHRTYYAPTPEALRIQVRQDIERHKAEPERNAQR